MTVQLETRPHGADKASAPSRPPQQAKKVAKWLCCASGKGGVGKTTTTANVGAALAASGKRVVLVDADVGLRNLDVVLGLESRVKYHLLDVLEEKVELDEALIRDKRCERLFLLAAAQSREKEDVDSTKMKTLIERLRTQFEFVLIDCPAGIEMGFKNAVIGAQHAVIVCTPEVSSVRDADRVVGLLPNDWRPELIVNRVKLQLIKKGKMLSVDDVNGILHLPLLGVIADEPDVIVSTNKGEPIAFRASSTVGAAYRTIAAKLTGKNVPAPYPKVEGGGLLALLSAIFGGR